MAARPGGKGPTLYEVAGWIEGVAAAPFRAVGWLLRKDVAAPEIPRWAAIPPRWRWVIVLTLGLVAGSTLLFTLYLWFHVLLVAVGWTPSEKAWDDIRFGLLIVAGVLSAPFVVWRTMIADRQTTINQQTHYTDLYTKAVEMLGADKVVKQDGVERSVPNIEVRLGAIYALQRIMNQSDDDYLPILKTLCAYVRENATFQERPSFSEGNPLPEPPEPPQGRDETAQELAERLTAIRLHANNLQAWGERLREKAAARGTPSAQRPDLRAALDVLCERPEERRLALEGIGYLEPPAFSFDWPDDLTPEAAQERREGFWIGRVVLARWAKNGRRLDLAAAALQGIDKVGADLRRANLTNAQLQGANLREARLQGADLTRAHLQGADLTAAQLQGADLTGARMEGADLRETCLQGTYLNEAWLQGANFRSAKLQAADLNEARLEEAHLRDAHMQGANLNFAHLVRANMAGANMAGVSIYEADVTGAFLAGAMLRDANNLTYDQLASAFGDAVTILPHDLEAMRPRLISETGWARDKIPLGELHQRWAAWRAARNL